MEMIEQGLGQVERPATRRTWRRGRPLNAVRGIIIASLICLAFWIGVAYVFLG